MMMGKYSLSNLETRMKTQETPIIVHIERVPHRYAVCRLRQAYRQLRLMSPGEAAATERPSAMPAALATSLQESEKCNP